MEKIKTNSLYGIFAKDIPEKPTITFGPRGNDSHWSFNGRPDMDADVGTEFANKLLFTMCRDRNLIKSIRKVTKEHPIFDITEGQLSTVNERNVSIVAHHICHFIDPSILCIVPIQIMVTFMTYYFGYTDNLKAYVHYDFRKYINEDRIIPHPFVASYTEKGRIMFLSERCMAFHADGPSIPRYKYIYSHEYLGATISKLQNDCQYDFVDVHPFTLLINIVTGCCNYYYFNYGWDYTKPSMELLLSYYMKEPDITNTLNYVENKKIWEARKKLGLSDKEPKTTKEPAPEECPFMKPESLISHMEMMLQIPRPRFLEMDPLIRSFNDLAMMYRGLQARVLLDHMAIRDPRKSIHEFFIDEMYSVTMKPQRSSYDISIWSVVPTSIYGRLHSGYDYGFLSTPVRDYAHTNPLIDMMVAYAERWKGRRSKHANT